MDMELEETQQYGEVSVPVPFSPAQEASASISTQEPYLNPLHKKLFYLAREHNDMVTFGGDGSKLVKSNESIRSIRA